MDAPNKKINTLDRLLHNGTCKHDLSTVDCKFARELCEQHKLYQSGDFFTLIDENGNHFVILYYAERGNVFESSCYKEWFQVIQV